MSLDLAVNYPLWADSDAPLRWLDTLLNAINPTTVCIPVVGGRTTATMMRSAADLPPLIVEVGSGWYYRVGGDAFPADVPKPPVSSFARRGKDRLKLACALLQERGTRRAFEIDIARGVASLEPESGVHRCSTWQQIRQLGCSVQPNFRALLRATLNDLARFEPDEIILSGLFDGDGRNDLVTVNGEVDHRSVVTTAAFRDLCGCSACRTLAEVESLEIEQIDRAARDAWAAVRYRSGGSDSSESGMSDASRRVDDDPGSRAVQLFRDARRGAILDATLADCAGLGETRVWLEVPAGIADVMADEFAALPEHFGIFETRLPNDEPRAQHESPDNEQRWTRFDLNATTQLDSSTIVRTCRTEAESRGSACLELAGCECEDTPWVLAAARQAFRYVRREAT